MMMLLPTVIIATRFQPWKFVYHHTIHLAAAGGCPTPILHNLDHHHLNNHLLSSTQQQEQLIEELMEMYEPDMDIAILWAERCRQEFLDVDFGSSVMSSSVAASELTTTTTVASGAVASGAGDSNDTLTGNEKSQHENQTTAAVPPISMSPSIQFLTFNHLLYGKSHKKEAQIVSLASKLSHRGFIVYGTPGIIGLMIMTNSTTNGGNGGGCGGGEEEVNEFAKECNRIGKRAAVLDFELKFTSDGEVLSSFEAGGMRNGNDDDGGKKNKSSLKNKKSKKGKGNGNDKNNKVNNSSSGSGGTGGSSTPLLINLLGADRVTTTNGAVSTIIANMKSGLRHFDSLAELKEVLPGDVVQNILGL